MRAYIRWRGDFYNVNVIVNGDRVSVAVEPENSELEEQVRTSVENDRFKLLAVYKGFGFDYLLSDDQRGN